MTDKIQTIRGNEKLVSRWANAPESSVKSAAVDEPPSGAQPGTPRPHRSRHRKRSHHKRPAATPAGAPTSAGSQSTQSSIGDTVDYDWADEAHKKNRKEMSESTKFVNRVFDVIENDVVPITKKHVDMGCKLFGAAIIKKDDLSLVVAESNFEVSNPMWHGEINCLNRFFEIPSEKRPAEKDCIFIATHEPCSLCLNGITWSGFDNFYYLFSHQDSMAEFGTPYDIQILEAIHRVPDSDGSVDPKRDLYNRNNSFFKSNGLKDIVKSLNDSALDERVRKLKLIYDDISATYQNNKGSHGLINP